MPFYPGRDRVQQNRKQQTGKGEKKQLQLEPDEQEGKQTDRDENKTAV